MIQSTTSLNGDTLPLIFLQNSEAFYSQDAIEKIIAAALSVGV
jgi:hypothetical protein